MKSVVWTATERNRSRSFLKSMSALDRSTIICV
jgi:hypothetical protein